jgi:hypothetical protein
MYYLDDETAISQATLSQMESLRLISPRHSPFHRLFSFPSPRLWHLELILLEADDASVARAILAVKQTLQSFVLRDWRGCSSVHQTLAAIGIAQSIELRSLELSECDCISYTMLEPFLVGIQPDQPPLWPNLRDVTVFAMSERGNRLMEREKHAKFIDSVRESMHRRFLGDGVVNSEEVCQPAKF